MNACLAEFIGTAMVVTFGNGVVANVVLARTKGNNGGWIVITAGWLIGLMVGWRLAYLYGRRLVTSRA